MPHGHLRFDFVALQRNGQAIRLHPGSQRDAILVRGHLEDWLIPSASAVAAASASNASGASTPGSAAGVFPRTHEVNQSPPTTTFQNFSRVDILSAELTHRILVDKVHEYLDAGVPACHIREDLLAGASTHGGFQWQRFFMGRQFGTQLLQEGVTSLHLISGATGVALEVKTAQHPGFLRMITFRGNTASLQGFQPC